MNIIIFDFEVFKYDTLLGCLIIDSANKIKLYQSWNTVDINRFYEKHKYDMWVGWNNDGYDNHILDAIVHNENPYYVSKDIIKNHRNKDLRIYLANYDIMKQRKGGFLSLKLTELIAGENIHTTDVDFNIDRPLNEEEKKLTEGYNKDDLFRTYKNFNLFKSDFELRVDLAQEFNLDLLSILNITGTMLGGKVLGVKKDWSLPNIPIKPKWYDTLQINNPTVKEWYMTEQYKKKCSLKLHLCGIDISIKSGGAHAGKNNYHVDKFLYFDVSGFYNLIQIKYNLFSRAIPEEGKKKYEKMYFDQLKMKKTNPIKRIGYKTVLLACWGGAGQEYSDFYDPHMAELIPITGEIFLIDLLEKLDTYVQAINVNTDGFAVVPLNWNDYDKIINIVTEWESRTGFTIKKEIKYNLWQRDVNTYICTDENGVLEYHGDDFKNINYDDEAFSKEAIFNNREASIIAKGIANFLLNGIMPEETVEKNKRDLRLFQYVGKPATYDYLTLDTTIYEKNANNKLIEINTVEDRVPSLVRLFAKPIIYKDNTIEISTIRKHKANKADKIASLPDSIFIYNESIIDDNNIDLLINKIDYEYYINRIYKKLSKFL